MYGTSVNAQTCYVINSVPATAPSSGSFDILVNSTAPGYYCYKGTRIYNSYDVNGVGTYTTIDTNRAFWIGKGSYPGPLNRCGVWTLHETKKVGFSVCVNVTQDKSYYMGFGADNSGILTIDGNVVLQNISFEYWGVYKINLSKGEHLIEFSVVNFGAEESIGFELYDNTETELLNSGSYGDLHLIYSTRQEFGAQVQEGDGITSWSCPVGFILDFCTPGAPLCSEYVPITLTINNPPPACSSPSVDLTSPQITAGSPTSLTFTYWKDKLATIPLPNPDKVTVSGTYYIMGTYNQCNLIEPVTVVVNSVSTTIEKAICAGDNYLGYTKSGTYTQSFTAANGCDSLVTINLTVSQPVNLGPDRRLCAGDSILLNPGNYSQYLWQDNSTTSKYVVSAPGTYIVQVTDANGCMSADTVTITSGYCLAKIPNTFSPNGDGINDTWKINGLDSYPRCTVLIYNRWGQPVFKSLGYPTPWDGNYNGKNLPAGTYYYVINLNNGGPPQPGWVTIIR